MNYHDFCHECVIRGFAKKGDSFYRCVGDGVFQQIFVGEKEKLPNDHPRRTPTHKFERTVIVFLKSMYGAYEGLFEGIESTLGFHLSVDRLLGNSADRFEGAEEEYEKMCTEGFQVLDTITSQNILAEFLTDRSNPDQAEMRYEIQFFDIYLSCGNYYQARMAVMTHFASNCFARYTKDATCLSQDEVKAYSTLYNLTWPLHSDAAKKRLSKNLAQNKARLEKSGLV